jgi:hypothetical protein
MITKAVPATVDEYCEVFDLEAVATDKHTMQTIHLAQLAV